MLKYHYSSGVAFSQLIDSIAHLEALATYDIVWELGHGSIRFIVQVQHGEGMCRGPNL